MDESVYVETTVPSYLTAWPSRDLVRAAHQQLTREWWTRRAAFDLYTSRLVIEECKAGDVAALLADVPCLDRTGEIDVLAAALARGLPPVERAASNARHIAIAAVYRVKYLLTWDHTGIANAMLRSWIDAVCLAGGHVPPVICTPEQLKPERSAADEDDVMRGVREAREAFAEAHGFDVDAMGATLRALNAAGDWPVASRVRPKSAAEGASEPVIYPASECGSDGG